ncbi:hypothetical protein [Roseateles depolymerans]|uniref:Uncharacterized protein n=1 Tax=Roseateles depolymerans TaxID=76731 RepID=A0A0U3NJA9_9BURK|nr:hypothetical protein [Roseateles depolymerans]ALV08496.1 hypothetical protein RD2015_4047 [Roseateles depolymerans]REG21278.1 hypothetical protein DES44_0392 [Roseateles depolymerans]
MSMPPLHADTWRPDESVHRPRQRIALGLSLAFSLATLLLTRHAQVPGLSSLTAPFALLILMGTLHFSKVTLAVVPMLLFCCVSLVVSVFLGNEASVGLRFLVITIATLVAFGVRSQPVSPAWALFPVALQALGIAILSITLSVMQDPLMGGAVRAYAITSDWGDVYTLDGLYYRVQVIGNALIPLLFAVCLWQPPTRWRRWGLILAVMGLLAAGNLTYFLMAGLAVFLRFKAYFYTHTRTWLTVFSVLAVVAVANSDVGIHSVTRKFDGAGSSMGVRFDQIDAVIRATDTLPAAVLTGAGLGSRFPNGRINDYSDSLYIELQALFVGYQLGLIGAAIYGATLLYCARHTLSREGRIIFWLYMLSGISNPYILDTNQIIATMLLVHLFPRTPHPSGLSPSPGEPAVPAMRPTPTVTPGSPAA